MVTAEKASYKVDSREPPKIRADVLKELEAEVSFLPSADYVVTIPIEGRVRRIGIERKETANLASSLTDGSLGDQMRRVLAEYDVAVLLVTDFMGCTWQGKVVSKYGTGRLPFSALLGALRSLQGAGVIVDYLPNEKWIVGYLRSVSAYWAKPGHGFLDQPKKITWHGRVNPLTNMIACIPGIGFELAERLRKKFPTMRALCDAEETELKEVKGIAEAKIKELRKYCR